MHVTVPSNKRYYRDEMDSVSWELILQAKEMLNTIKFQMYDAHYMHTYHKGKRGDVLQNVKSPLYTYATDLGLGSLYANMMVPYVTGLLKSQVSNRENYKDDLEDEIESIREKLKDTREDLDHQKKIKDSIVIYAKTGKWKKPYKKSKIKIDKHGTLSGFGIDPCDYREYEYKVEERIRWLKHKCKMLEEAVKRRERKAAKLKELPPKRSIFGSRRLYKQKDTIGNTPEWKQRFHDARFRSITISGRADSYCGNFIVKYDKDTRGLTWILPDKNEVIFEEFCPKRHAKEYMDIMQDHANHRLPVAYTFEQRKDGNGREFILIKTSFEIPEPDSCNVSFADGCISTDINVDRLAWTELDGMGKMLAHGVIPMDLAGLSIEQAADKIGRACRILTSMAAGKKKPIVHENLEPAGMKKKMKYQNKTRNKKISQFACGRIINTLRSQAAAYGIPMVSVNPKYTSFMGKVLFMRKAGLSVHEAASYAIGLRGMGILPEPPAACASFIPKGYPDWANDSEKQYYYRWRSVYNSMKGIPQHLFYRKLPAFQNKKEINVWIKECLA